MNTKRKRSDAKARKTRSSDNPNGKSVAYKKKKGASRKRNKPVNQPRRKIGRYISLLVFIVLVIGNWQALSGLPGISNVDAFFVTRFNQFDAILNDKEKPKSDGVDVVDKLWFGDAWNEFKTYIAEISWRESKSDHQNKGLKKHAVEKVIVEGQLRYLDKGRLQEDFLGLINQDFVKLNLEEIRVSLRSNPWIRNVSIRRVWPSSISVHVEEEHPIAIWGDKGFLSSYGDIIEIDDVSGLKNLPVLKGDEANAYEIAKEYLLISKLLNPEALQVTSLSVSKSGEWRLSVNNKFALFLGGKEISSRIERFIFLYERQLAPYEDQINRIDMRYSQGIAVQWKKEAVSHLSMQ